MTLFIAADIEARAVVWLFTGSSNSDADFAAYIASIESFDKQCAGRDGAALCVVDAGNPAPTSAWRKKIADVSAALESKPAFALVSTSPLIRGALTAINWLRPPPYPFTTAATFAEASAWIEGKLKRPLPLTRLLAEARAQQGGGA